MAINASDIFSSGGGGGFKPHVDLGTQTGTVELDYGVNQSYRLVQGAGNLTVNINNDPTVRAQGELLIKRDTLFNTTFNNVTFFQQPLFNNNLNSASYDNVSFSVGNLDIGPQSIAFSNDGTKMFMVGFGEDNVHSYTLSTAWNLSTASYDNVSFQVGNQDTIPESIAFSNDGTKMFMVGSGSGRVYSYTLSTAWNLSTASYDAVLFSISSEDSDPSGIAFSDDGTKMFMVGRSTRNVHSYTLSTAWNLSTTSYDTVSFSISTEDSDPSGIAFSDDGTKMFMVGRTAESVHSYTLSTAWNLSTASYDAVSFSVGQQDNDPRGIAFSNDGIKMFILGSKAGSVYSYSLFEFSKILCTQFGTNIALEGEQIAYDFV